MALFSDMDWVIIAAVAVFLLFGSNNTAMMRKLGRYYAQLIRMKQSLMTEVTKAANLPTPSPGQPFSIRTALLGSETADSASPAAPLRLTPSVNAITATYRPALPTDLPWTGATPTPTWSVALPAVGPEPSEAIR